MLRSQSAPLAFLGPRLLGRGREAKKGTYHAGVAQSWPGGILASQDTPAAELNSLSLDSGARSHTSGEILSPKRASTLRASTQSERGAAGDRWSH